MLSPDPLQAAQRQIERDRAATRAFPSLFGKKQARMSGTPLAYLRGTAPLFYELLAEHPDLAAGPAGEGWLVGDAHLENFGAFRTADAHESAVFDVNDFDEAIIGPLRWDVVRLLTSLILGGRELGSSGKQSVALCSSILDGYVEALATNSVPQAPPAPVRRLLEKVDQRTHKDLLDRRTERFGDGRRFIRGDRYPELAAELVPKARAAFATYVERLDPDRKLQRDHFIVEDVAFRVAGCGSLGALRVAVLTRGKGELDSRWIFDMKAEGAPSAQGLLGAPTEQPAERAPATHDGHDRARRTIDVRAPLATAGRQARSRALAARRIAGPRPSPRRVARSCPRTRGKDTARTELGSRRSRGVDRACHRHLRFSRSRILGAVQDALRARYLTSI